MCGQLICAAAVLLAVDAGWQPLPDGGVEYLIQIEPHMLDRLRAGESVHSDIPPDVWDVRAYRITLGDGRLPREQADGQGSPATRRENFSSELATASPRMAALASRDDPLAPRFSPPAYRPGGEASEPPRWGMEETDDTLATDRRPPPAQISPPEFAPAQFPPAEEPPAASWSQDSGGDQPANSTPQFTPPESPFAEPPRAIEPDPASEPLEAEVASYVTDSGGASTSDEQTKERTATAMEPSPGRPWLPLIGTLLGLFTSLGANVFLAWATWDARRRYRTLAEENGAGRSPSVEL